MATSHHRAEATDPGPLTTDGPWHRAVTVPCGGQRLPGWLSLPAKPMGLVVFAHGLGSSSLSHRNRQVAATLLGGELATLLFDLKAVDEAAMPVDINCLAGRVTATLDWLGSSEVAALPVGLYGSSLGAAVAVTAAEARPEQVRAVVSRGGRVDLVSGRLHHLDTPILLIVGSRDVDLLELNRWAAGQIEAPHQLTVITGAGHLFREPGALEQVAEASLHWFQHWLTATAHPWPTADHGG
jgi:putative phosphoribosyl transferase